MTDKDKSKKRHWYDGKEKPAPVTDDLGSTPVDDDAKFEPQEIPADSRPLADPSGVEIVPPTIPFGDPAESSQQPLPYAVPDSQAQFFEQNPVKYPDTNPGRGPHYPPPDDTPRTIDPPVTGTPVHRPEELLENPTVDHKADPFAVCVTCKHNANAHTGRKCTLKVSEDAEGEAVFCDCKAFTL